MIVRHVLPGVFVFAALTMCTIVDAETVRLTNADLIDFTNNKKYAGTSIEGYSFNVSFRSDGTMEAEAQGSLDSGVWEIEGEQLCLKWDQWRYGSRYCQRIERRADGRLLTFLPNGDRGSSFLPNE